jgi:hypothetical protein
LQVRSGILDYHGDSEKSHRPTYEQNEKLKERQTALLAGSANVVWGFG